ncbi:MAG: nuclear transport factor 2 family protein [Alphaproteobacteria bacterium]|nr:nuclear transport factor 2 family protein [Alphaproteobacteria bacterium]
MASLDDELGAFLGTYYARFSAADYDGMLQLWDRDEPAPIYVAEEGDPFVGWPAIEGYFANNRRVLAALKVRTWNLQTRQPVPDLAIAFYEMHWNAKTTGALGHQLMAGFNRVSALLRRKPAGWRLFHYIEAPLASPVYARRVARFAVDPDFAVAHAPKS